MVILITRYIALLIITVSNSLHRPGRRRPAAGCHRQARRVHRQLGWLPRLPHAAQDRTAGARAGHDPDVVGPPRNDAGLEGTGTGRALDHGRHRNKYRLRRSMGQFSYTANLTPDRNTGLGIWTEDMFVKAIKTGKHMGTSRPINPPMPWPAYRNLTEDDLKAVFAYLRTIPPIVNHVPDYLPPPATTTTEAR